METIGERIFHLRELCRLTQRQLGEQIHLSDKVISKWEKNESKPNLEDVTALSQFFGVSYDYLISGKATKQDEEVIFKQPTEEELIDAAKKNFIKQCNAIIREKNLYKYKDKIFPEKLCENFLNEQVPKNCAYIGIFHPLIINETEPYAIGINMKSLLAFDDYNLFEKIIALNFPFYDKNDVIEFFKTDALLSDKDIHGLTDTRFYEFLSDQTVLIKQSYERLPIKERLYSFNEFLNRNSYEYYYKAILSEALEKLERKNPNYWEIVKILIEKGAVLKKAVNVHYGEYGDMSLHMDYADDLIVTELFYELACAKTSK